MLARGRVSPSLPRVALLSDQSQFLVRSMVITPPKIAILERRSTIRISFLLSLPLFFASVAVSQDTDVLPCLELFVHTTNSNGITNTFQAQSQYSFLWDKYASFIQDNGNQNGWFSSSFDITGNYPGDQFGWDWNWDCSPQIQRGLYKISVSTAGKSASFFIDYRGCYNEPGDVTVTYDYQADDFLRNGSSIKRPDDQTP